MKHIPLKEKLTNLDEFEDFQSQYTDCYVYELFIKDTGEIFYVGYDSKEQRDEPLDYPSLCYNGCANMIEKRLKTEKRILKTGLREAAASHYTRKRIAEIRETNMLCDRKNTSHLSNSDFKVGITPKLEVSPIEQHYLGMESKTFDNVNLSNLTTIYLETSFLGKEIIEGLYGNRYTEYYNDLNNKLKSFGSKIIASQYAKSVTAWIYLGGSTRTNYEIAQECAKQKLGRNIPTYHIFDVIDALKDFSVKNTDNTLNSDIEIHAINNRCPWKNIKNLHDERAGFTAGFRFYEKGEALRLRNDIEGALLLFDEARENGYNAPALYASYEKAYRKIKDYDNEIAILLEYYERNHELHGTDPVWAPFFIRLEEKITKAKKQLIQSKRNM